MPTNRTRIRREFLPELSAVKLAYLLDQEMPTELDRADVWWSICECHATDPSMAHWPRSARKLWQDYRAELLPVWQGLHGRRRHPFDLDPPGWPATAEASLRERLEAERERRARVVAPIRTPG